MAHIKNDCANSRLRKYSIENYITEGETVH